MKSVEMRARRVTLGLSVGEVARLCGQNMKHWRDWEAGRRDIPPQAAHALRDLCAQYAAAVDEAAALAEAKHERDGEPARLVIHAQIESFERAGGEAFYGVPWSGHSALVGLCQFVLELDGIPCELVPVYDGRKAGPSLTFEAIWPENENGADDE